MFMLKCGAIKLFILEIRSCRVCFFIFFLALVEKFTASSGLSVATEKKLFIFKTTSPGVIIEVLNTPDNINNNNNNNHGM